MKDKTQENTENLLPKTEIPGLVQARKLVVGVIGFTVLVIGFCLLVLPGPAFIVIPAGLAILATEFVWARRWLRKAKQTFTEAKDNYFNVNRSKNRPEEGDRKEGETR